jgi:hypothetical protein
VTSSTLRRVRRGAVASLATVALAASLQPSPFTAFADTATPWLRPATPELIERDVRRGAITPAQGSLFLSWAFTAPERLPETYVSDTPWSGTLPLLRLRERLPALGDAPAALAARAALRAVTYSCPGTSGSPPHVKSTKHFYLQYQASALQGLSIRQYARALETAWATEIGEFKWAKPPRDPFRTPPGGRYPVRVEDLQSSLYGYVTGTAIAGDNPSTSWNDRDAVASCMVLNSNFGPFPGDPIDALRATAAHEFNHSIQFGYGALTGYGRVTGVMIEGLATWMEDEVFDSSDDSYNYLWPEFVLPMGRYRKSPYPDWVVFRAMTERFGTGRRNGGEAVVQVFWEQISKGSTTNLAALAKGFKAKGSRLGDAYHNASIALRFLVDCSTTARRLCLEEGPAYSAATRGGNSDHANLNAAPDSLSRSIPNDFALNWIGLPTAASLDLTVVHNGGKGALRVSIACRTGGAVTATPVGTATRSADAVLDGVDLSACDEASAVISNVTLTDPTPRSITRTDYTIEIV